MKPFLSTHFQNALRFGGALALLPALGASAQAASTFTVTTVADSGGGSLRAAITSANLPANSGSTIVFAPKLAGTIALSSAEPTITQSMTIQGNGAIAVDGGSASRIFQVTGGMVNISGLTLQNGFAGSGANGGAVLNTNSNLFFIRCTFLNCQADYGGAIANSGVLGLGRCLFRGSSAVFGGGAVYNQNLVVALACVLRGNSAQFGGGIDNDTAGSLTLTSATFTGNSAQFGGGVFNSGASSVADTILYGDTAQTGGREVYSNGGVVNATFSDIQQAAGNNSFTDASTRATTILNVDPLFVAAPSDLHLQDASPVAAAGSTSVSGYSAVDFDGLPRHSPPSIGAYEFELPNLVSNTNDSGPGSLRAAIVYTNGPNAPAGGSFITFASSVKGTITLASPLPDITAPVAIVGPTGSTLAIDGAGKFSLFHVKGTSGSLTTSGSTLVVSITGLTLQNSLASASGGAVYASVIPPADGSPISPLADTVALNNCVLSGNLAPNGSGGAVFGDIGTEITLTACKLYGNSAQNGGALASVDTLTVNTCAFVGNTATIQGGALGLGANSTLNLTGSTLTANSAPSGGALASLGTATLTDDILFGDTGGEITLTGTGTAKATFSDIAQTSGIYPGASNINADPLFTRVPSLSGVTPDYGDLHLQNGSPALGSGTVVTSNTSDLDGVQRNDPPSIGAYELPLGAFISFTVTTTADSGTGSLRDALQQASSAGSPVTILFAPGVGGVIQLGSALPNIVNPTTLRGPGAGKLVIDGGGKFRIFHVMALTGLTTISGLTLQNGSDKNDSNGGGAVLNDGGSALALTACSIRGNRAAFLGGGIDNSGALAVTACAFSVNRAGSQGGGVYNGGTLTLIGNTFSGGSAPSGGGLSNTGTATLTDDIFFGDTGGEIANFNTLTAAYSDIAQATGVFTGTGNLNTDPKFVRAPNPGLTPSDYGDLHLQVGSPAAFAGIAVSGNAKDLAGVLRTTPPSLGALDQSVTHILYTRSDGSASVATFSAGLLTTRADYGPFSGWTAKSLAEGPNGSVRILWNNVDGRVALWNLSDAVPSNTAAIYGPYSGWTATSLTVGPDNAAHLLWDNVSGQVALWNTTDPSPAYTAALYGPYPGWSGTAISIGANNQERLLWNNTSGQIAVWNLTDSAPDQNYQLYGPFSGWTAKTISVGPDNAAHLLWDNVSGQVAVWNLNDPNPVATTFLAGPYIGWAGQDLSAAPDGTLRLLWDNTNGSIALWNLGDANPAVTYQLFGPFDTATAVSLATGS